MSTYYGGNYTNIYVYLGQQSPVTIGPHATISNTGTIVNGDALYASGVYGVFWNIVNQGTLLGNPNLNSAGAYLQSGGYLQNRGSISGGRWGVYIAGKPPGYGVGTVANYGAIDGPAAGVALKDGGIVRNAASAEIIGSVAGIALYQRGDVTNSGLIQALSVAGVVLNADGIVANLQGGVIEGAVDGVLAPNGGAVTNDLGGIAGGTFGVALLAGGYVRNGSSGASGAVISGGTIGVRVAGSAGSVVNFGTIRGPASAGVFLGAGGDVTNGQGGTIQGGPIFYSGVLISGGRGTVVNLGAISGGYGVSLNSGGYVDNGPGGVISGSITIGGSAGTVVNSGTLSGGELSGVVLNAGGRVTNTQAGTIDNRVVIYGAGAVSNSGSISGLDGVDLRGGGTLTNAQGAVLAGGNVGVYLNGASEIANEGRITGYDSGIEVGPSAQGAVVTNARGAVVNSTGTSAVATVVRSVAGIQVLPANVTVVNAGTVAGQNGTAISFAGGDRLVFDPGGAFSGVVNGGSSGSVLELGPGASTFAGLGASFIDFPTVVFDPGAAWTLDLANSAALGAAFSGFARGDVLDLAGVADGDYTYSGGVLSLAGSVDLRLTVATPYADSAFVLTADGSGGTDVAVLPNIPLDLFGNANSDLLWQNANGNVMVWTMAGDTVQAQAVLAQSYPGVRLDGTGYFDASGRSGVLFEEATGAVGVAYAGANGPVLDLFAGAPAADPNWQVVGAGDFTGDGHSDLLWQYENTGNPGDPNNGAIRLSFVGANFTITATTGSVVYAGWRAVGAGDFTGDGVDDVLAQYVGAPIGGLQTGDVAIIDPPGNPVVVTLNGTPVHPGSGWKVIGAADFDGDGKSDIFAQFTAASTGTFKTGDIGVALMNGTAVTTLADIGNPGSGWTAAGSGEFDGDNKADIFFQDAAGDQAMIWLMNGISYKPGPILDSKYGGGWTLQHG